MQRILIVGATSAIAEACARLWAARGAALLLAGRDLQRCAAIAADLRLRGAAQVETFVFDAEREPADLPAAIRATRQALDVVLIAHGQLPDQQACERDLSALRSSYRINQLSVIELASAFTEILRDQGHGTLAVISSVAGDRVRASNYVYGSAKAAVSGYLSGLRQQARNRTLRILTVKPGPVDTPMTRGFAVKGLLWSTPSRVAHDILRGIDRRRTVVYTPGFWRWIMAVIVHLPERLLAALRL